MIKKNRLGKQQGLTMISWMIVISIALFFTMIGIKMIPTYMENYSIKQILNGMAEDRSLRKMDRHELKKTALKRFKINAVYDFDKDKLKLNKVKGGIEISVDYEVRKLIIGNASVVMTFDHKVEIPQ